MKKPIPDEMFTNLRAGRSRKAFPIKEKRSLLPYAIIALMIVACGAIYLSNVRLERQLQGQLQASINGCIASAYQATQNGFDLEANLAVCKD